MVTESAQQASDFCKLLTDLLLHLLYTGHSVFYEAGRHGVILSIAIFAWQQLDWGVF